MEENNSMTTKNYKLTAPDGGYGWIVCLGCSFINLSLRALDPSFGLLFGDLLKELNVDTTGASVIMSLLEALLCFSGIISGVLIKKFGYRKVACLGALLNCTGLMLTSRAKSMTFIICTYSIIGGLGAGLGTSATFVAVSSYFREKRTQAVGFSMAGTSLGMMCMPQVVHLLLSHYDFRGTVLILSAINFHSMIGCCLLQPVKYHMKKVPCDEKLDVKKTGPAEAEEDALLKAEREFEEVKLRKISLSRSISDISGVHVTENYHKREKSVEKGAPQSLSTKIIALFDLDVLKDPRIINIMIGLSFVITSDMNFKLITPFFLSDIGMTKAEIAFCLSLTALADVLTRLTLPTIINRMRFSNRKVFWWSCIGLAITRSTIAMQYPGKILASLLFINGIIRGVNITNLNLCISEHCSLLVLPSALGIFNVLRGVTVATLGPLLGYIRDASGSYRILVHTTSAMMLVCFISWGVEWCLEKYRKRSSAEIEKENEISEVA